MATAKKAAQAKAKSGEAEDAAKDEEGEDEPVEPQDNGGNGGGGNDDKPGAGGGDLDLSVKKDFISVKVARDGNEADTFQRIADLVEGWGG
jgi:hypothetical protein